MKLLALAALSIRLLAADDVGSSTVRGIAYSVDRVTTIVAIELSGGFDYRLGRLHEPERVNFDIPRGKPWINSRATYTRDLDNALIIRVGVAETAPSVTRVVLDSSNLVGISVTKVSDPARLRVQLKAALGETIKRSAADISSTDGPGVEIPKDERQLAQATLPEPPRAAPAVSAKPSLSLSISPDSAAPGGAATMVIALISASDDEPAALQWQISYPSPQIGIQSGRIAVAEGPKSAGKTVTCAGKPEGAGAYTYTCIVAGGTKAIPTGPLALLPLQVRATARTGTVRMRLNSAIGVHADGRATGLADTTATFQIQ